MPELESSKKVQAAPEAKEVKTEKPGKAQKSNSSSPIEDISVPDKKAEQKKLADRNDAFKLVNNNLEDFALELKEKNAKNTRKQNEEKSLQQKLTEKSLEFRKSIQEKLAKTPASPQVSIVNTPTYNTITSFQQKMMMPFNKMQESLSSTKAKFIDISDKLAAVYGEREKDLRERLSDTFKTTETKVFQLLEKVDTAMEQKDHSQQKKWKPFEKSQKDDEDANKGKKIHSWSSKSNLNNHPFIKKGNYSL